jgi:hypothetical protein
MTSGAGAQPPRLHLLGALAGTGHRTSDIGHRTSRHQLPPPPLQLFQHRRHARPVRTYRSTLGCRRKSRTSNGTQHGAGHRGAQGKMESHSQTARDDQKLTSQRCATISSSRPSSVWYSDSRLCPPFLLRTNPSPARSMDLCASTGAEIKNPSSDRKRRVGG